MNKLFYRLTIIIMVLGFINFNILTSEATIKNKECKVKFIAHRGLSSCAPENTIPAYVLAGKNNFYACECDVQETKDNEFIIMHDDTIDRMTDGCGKVSDFTLEELKKFNIDAGANIDKYRNLKIPTLEEYLNVCNEEKIKSVIEVKNLSKRSIKKFLNTINESKTEENVIIISFNKQILEDIRHKDSSINIQWLADLTKENIDFCAENNMNIDSDNKTVTKECIEYAHDKGVLVNVWTVDEPEMINLLVSYGVDFISTNKLNSLWKNSKINNEN